MLKGNRFSSKSGRFHQSTSKFGMGTGFNMKSGGSASRALADDAGRTEPAMNDIAGDSSAQFYSNDTHEDI